LRTVLILKAGTLAPVSDEFVLRHGDTEDTFIKSAGLGADEVEVVDVFRDVALPPVGQHAAVIVTGASAMVTEQAPWMLRTAEWLRRAVAQEQMVLGVCFGHQLLAHALGGTVGPLPAGIEAGSVSVSLHEGLEDDPLFGAVPASSRFQSHHYQVVLAPPPGAAILGRTALDPHQVLRHGPRVWGVQFHPELDLAMMKMLMDALWDDHAAFGIDPTALDAGLSETAEGPALLRRFVALSRA
jgi:GMP synthase (glutamine-hydrolysing)